MSWLFASVSVTLSDDVNVESTKGLLLIHNPTTDTLLISDCLTRAINWENAQSENDADTNTWQALQQSHDLNAIVSERLCQHLSHLLADHLGTNGPT